MGVEYSNPRMSGKAKLYLKDGEVVEGEIVFDGKEEIYIKIDDLNCVVLKHEIKKVELVGNKIKYRPLER